MTERDAYRTIHIDDAGSYLLQDAAGLELSCLSGSVWVTQYGDQRDIVVHAGQCFTLGLPTATVISAVHGATITLARKRRPAAGGSLWRYLLSLFSPRWSSRVAAALGTRIRGLQG